MKSGNPVLRSDTFDAVPAGERMTVNGTINKTAMMLALVMITAIYTWGRFTATNDPASIMPLVWTGAIGGFIVCLITVFKTEWAAFTALNAEMSPQCTVITEKKTPLVSE